MCSTHLGKFRIDTKTRECLEPILAFSFAFSFVLCLSCNPYVWRYLLRGDADAGVADAGATDAATILTTELLR